MYIYESQYSYLQFLLQKWCSGLVNAMLILTTGGQTSLIKCRVLSSIHTALKITCGISCILGILFYTEKKYPCLSLSFHLSPYLTMLLKPHTDWKILTGARQMRFVLHKAWFLFLGCAVGWLHPMLCEWCLSSSVPGGYFSKVEDIFPFLPSASGTTDWVTLLAQ